MSKGSKINKGFTIVELLIVIVVIAILATITIVAYNGITRQAQSSALESSAQQVAKKVVAYSVENGDAYPGTLADAGFADSGGTTYQYTPNTSGTSYCITVTNNDSVISIGGIDKSINNTVPGPCPGHNGSAPTTLDNGASCPAGYILVPGSSVFGTRAFCVMKYEAKNVSGVATSQAGGVPWVSISQNTAIATAKAACANCHLMTESEWMTLAANVLSVPSNWSGGAVGSGYIYSGHSDNSPANSLAASADNDGYSGTGDTSGTQRRTLTLTNDEVIWDMAGNVWEWTDATINGKKPSGSGWYEWNTATMNDFPKLSQPKIISTAAAGWNTAQGIGRLYTLGVTDTSNRAFLRGGSMSNYPSTGVLALQLYYTPTGSTTYAGFRVAQ